MSSGPTGTRDASFDAPYTDVDEWRDDPVRHRYVHGGFEGTDTRFSIYLPPAERYEGRFFQPLMPISGTEHAATMGLLAGTGGSIDFALATGGYLLESNMGRMTPFPGDDPTIAGYRASAAVARYSRVVAAEMYGEHRPYGYVYGGSGGAYKTMSCFETELGLWDGAVPYVHGTPMSLPSVFTVQNHAIRLLRDKFPQIVDALEPGGSGDMFAGLNAEEREALAEVTRMGFPPRAWFDVDRVARQYTGVWSLLCDNVIKWDPEYFEDFWTVPGYLGFDAPQSLSQVRVQHKTSITALVMRDEAASLGLAAPMTMNIGANVDAPFAVRIADLPDQNLQGTALNMLSGKAAGRVIYIVDVVGDVAVVGFGEQHEEGLRGVEVGDEVMIDNSNYLASQTYHRHQVDTNYLQWDQFHVAGRPIYPQRARLMGPGYAWQGAGSVQSGRFTGKMIVVQSLMDEAAYPVQADWYRQQVLARLGPNLDDNYRLWFVEHAMHTAPMVFPGEPAPVRTTRVVSYLGVLQQALRDVADWVEKGLAPPQSTTYEIRDGQVIVPSTANDRGGIQPVVHVTANGAARADVAVGEPVEFVAEIAVPPGAGAVVVAEWDFEGEGDFPVADQPFNGVGGSLARLTVRTSHVFAAPGTYFPALRVTSQRQGDADTRFARVQNLGRVRVVVG